MGLLGILTRGALRIKVKGGAKFGNAVRKSFRVPGGNRLILPVRLPGIRHQCQHFGDRPSPAIPAG